jgi:hypothetical protein
LSNFSSRFFFNSKKLFDMLKTGFTAGLNATKGKIYGSVAKSTAAPSASLAGGLTRQGREKTGKGFDI